MLSEEISVREIKPVLSGYLAEALMLMKSSPVPDDSSVHDIRVLMKKSRAVMKLLSMQIDPDVLQKEYLIFRDTGRALCAFREISVHRKTLKMLRKSHQELFLRLSENLKIGQLLTKNESLGTSQPPPTDSLLTTISILNKSAYRIRFLQIKNPDPMLLFMELEKSYAIIYQDYIECRNKPKPARLHQLRKRLKDLLYQLYFFRPVNPRAIKTLEKQLTGLTQDLGCYNDLNQLLNELGYNDPDIVRTEAMDELMLLIRQKQDQFMAKVWPVAFKIFCPGHKLSDLLGYRSELTEPVVINDSETVIR